MSKDYSAGHLSFGMRCVQEITFEKNRLGAISMSQVAEIIDRVDRERRDSAPGRDTLDQSVEDEPEAFLPVRQWTPESDQDENQEDEPAEPSKEQVAAVEPTSVRQAYSMLAFYQQFLSPVQHAHLVEQFEASIAENPAKAGPLLAQAKHRGAIQLRLSKKDARAILSLVQERLQDRVVGGSFTGEELVSEALRQADKCGRTLVQPDAKLYLALLAANESAV